MILILLFCLMLLETLLLIFNKIDIYKIYPMLSSLQSLIDTINTVRPFDQIQLKNLQQWFKIGFVQTSNALEGNTLTLSEVKVLIEDGVTIWGKTMRELHETTNLADITPYIWDEGFQWTEQAILWLHQHLISNIDDEHAGCYRDIPIMVSGSDEIFPEPSQVWFLMKDYLDYLQTTIPQTLEETLQLVSRTHYDLVKIHPFVDGNGRMARLMMNIMLVKYNLLPIIIPPVVRHDYVSSLQPSQTFQDFYEFLVWQITENYKDYKRFLHLP